MKRDEIEKDRAKGKKRREQEVCTIDVLSIMYVYICTFWKPRAAWAKPILPPGRARPHLLAFHRLNAELVLQKHVVVRRQADAGPHDVDQAAALREEGIHYRRARRYQRRLDEEAENRQNRVEALKISLALAAHL